MAAYWESFKNWTKSNPYQVIGITAGFLIGLLVILIGFWKMLFILFMAFVGFLIGKKKDDGSGFSDFIKPVKDLFKGGKDQ